MLPCTDYDSSEYITSQEQLLQLLEIAKSCMYNLTIVNPDQTTKVIYGNK